MPYVEPCQHPPYYEQRERCGCRVCLTCGDTIEECAGPDCVTDEADWRDDEGLEPLEKYE